jgi:hypothetical protein
VQQYSKTYNESGDHRSMFYAESSLVVHYLYDNQLMLKLAEYFDARLNQKKPIEQAIQQAFGMTPEQFDKVLHNYLSSGRFKYYPVPTPSGIVAAQFTERPVSLADARAVLADIDALTTMSGRLANFRTCSRWIPTMLLRCAGLDTPIYSGGILTMPENIFSAPPNATAKILVCIITMPC